MRELNNKHMNFTYTRKSISVLAVTVFIVSVFGFATANVSAAPHSDYFADTSQDAENAFTAWFSQFDNADDGQCDSYDAIFTADCLGTNEGNFESLAGVAAWFAQLTGNNNDDDNTEETEVVSETSVTLLDQRCFNNDGAVELGFMHVTGYEVTRNGDIYTVGDISEEDNLDFQTLTVLPDGSYIINVFNNEDSDQLSFNVSCDEEGDGGDGDQLNAVCSVSPDEPEIDEQITWQVSASGGDGPYNYSWFGDVSGSNASVTTSYGDSGEKEGRVTVSSGNVFETVRCTVDVQDDDGEVMGAQTSRTIEEF